MRANPTFTYILLIVVLLTAVVSISTSRSRVDDSGPGQTKNQSRIRRTDEDVKRQYPTTDYNELEPTDPNKRAQRKEKQKRHNNFHFVEGNLPPNTGAIEFSPEKNFDFPALPTRLSDTIVLVDVLDAGAHLSENKKNVYSEFSVVVKQLFKIKTSGSVTLTVGSITSVERIGGWVTYPDGRKILYRISGFGMPRVGGRYVLFLNSIGQSNDYTILTGYELSPSGVVPLDYSAQFDVFSGYEEGPFLEALNDALTKTPIVQN